MGICYNKLYNYTNVVHCTGDDFSATTVSDLDDNVQATFGCIILQRFNARMRPKDDYEKRSNPIMWSDYYLFYSAHYNILVFS